MPLCIATTMPGRRTPKSGTISDRMAASRDGGTTTMTAAARIVRLLAQRVSPRATEPRQFVPIGGASVRAHPQRHIGGFGSVHLLATQRAGGMQCVPVSAVLHDAPSMPTAEHFPAR